MQSKKLYKELPKVLSSTWFYRSLNLNILNTITKEEENVSTKDTSNVNNAPNICTSASFEKDYAVMSVSSAFF